MKYDKFNYNHNEPNPRWLKAPINSQKEHSYNLMKKFMYLYMVFLLGVASGYAWCHYHNSQQDKIIQIERRF